MNKQIAVKTREKWVDDVKVIACILVALGHFFMSMVQSGILPDSNLHEWFITTIYYFHVPLFFICSGYLYQKWKAGTEMWLKKRWRSAYRMPLLQLLLGY